MMPEARTATSRLRGCMRTCSSRLRLRGPPTCHCAPFAANVGSVLQPCTTNTVVAVELGLVRLGHRPDRSHCLRDHADDLSLVGNGLAVEGLGFELPVCHHSCSPIR